MRFAFIAPEFLPTWGGVGVYAVLLLKELSKDPGLDIHVVTPKRGKNYAKKKIEAFFGNKITIHNVSEAKDTFFYNFKFQLALLRMFPRLQKKYQFDLVHAANLTHMPDLFLKFRPSAAASICTAHTTYESQSRIQGRKRAPGALLRGEPVELCSRLASPYIAFMQSRYIQRTKHFIAVSHFIAGYLKEHTSVRVIHNGVDTDRFRPGENNHFKRFDKILSPKVLYTGRLLYMKGISLLIKALRQVLKRQEVHVIFAGTGSHKRWKKELKGIPRKYYSFLGYVPYEKIHYLYQKCDLFILPSYTESFPLTLLEAMATGLPVIASRVGGIPEMMLEGETGRLVEVGQYKLLADAMLELIMDPQRMHDMGMRGREHVLHNFTTEKMARETLNYYKEVLG